MGRFVKPVTSLNPNSEYHRILIKNLGYEGAIKAINRCSLAYSMDMVSYRKIVKWQPNKKLSPSLAK